MTTFAEEQLNKLELTIEDAQEKVALAEKLQRLHNNKDFQEIILEKFFRDESHRVVMAKADPAMQGDVDQKGLDDLMTAIGELYKYFHMIFVFGEGAARALEADSQTRTEILAEEAAEASSQLVN